ncbi:hypothetical protein M8C21_017607 [Ambrosia artemisiifolia]|uniref:Serine/threonine/dual specificity protein kinase, catalytic domain-containing protein n=1 Tax=Ambrosia artemisiifolia TaxID=4212 RepID=A0AAD5CQA1_AMBAR|nr:hypothetical protein M8C21_017607 [Ambrosia artemisiifolia]
MSALKESQHLKIPLKDIEIATNNFQHCIGIGGYGNVYKGELLIHGKSTIVAVKRLNEQFGQGLKEFLTEIQLLSGQNHPNLISLLGYCDEGKEKIIVYEYAANGSLDQYLRRGSNVPALTWMERLIICVDAARGLNHLHHEVGKHQTIIHRDIKSSNILIDNNWVAKISDLGLSKLGLSGLNRSAVISRVCGTPGYCEPEYFSTGIVTKESDVYSFGIVLFEVLCGKLCCTVDHDGFQLSATVVKDYYKKKKVSEIVDPILKEQMSSELIRDFSKIAYRCLHEDRDQRPPMTLVVKKLERLLAIQDVLLKAAESTLSDVIKPAHPLVREGGNASEIPLDISVLSNMRDFVKYNRLKQFALRALASTLDEDELWHLKDQFYAIDVDKNGAISLEEMRDAFAKDLPWKLKETRVLEILKAIDSNADGLVDFTDFVAATLNVYQLEGQDSERWQILSQAAFEKFDVDRDGYITPEDIRMHTGLKGSIDLLLKEADIDKDCKISLSDFCRLLGT